MDLLPEPTNLDVGIISSFGDFLTGNSNLLDPHADPPTTSSKTHHSSPRHLTRVKTLPTHLRNYHCFFAIASFHEPHYFRKARTDPLWQKAMPEELSALSQTHTWDLVDLPSGKITVGCKWVYKIKTKFDGFVERYKASLMAKGVQSGV